jgi:hypothetical protein
MHVQRRLRDTHTCTHEARTFCADGSQHGHVLCAQPQRHDERAATACI